jgi:hypothetical protein
MTKTSDEKIEQIFTILQEKKKALLSAEKPKWKTHLSFSYQEEGRNVERINIQVCNDLQILVNIAAFLISKKEYTDKAYQLLNVSKSFPFWHNFSYEDWMSDISTRVNQLQISSKKKEIEDLEKKLDVLVSPEKRREMELEAITKSLADL